jgi:hypothetical protein
MEMNPKIIVHYMTEFGSDLTTLELSELVDFFKRFKVISLDYLDEQ